MTNGRGRWVLAMIALAMGMRAVAVVRADAPAPASPETLRRVRITTAEPAALAARLEAAGDDLHVAQVGSSPPDAVELIVSADRLATLREEGYDVTVVQRGRPLRDILGERGRARGGVPEGYLDLDQVLAAMADAAAAYPSICRLVDLTETYGAPPTFEGRHLHALKISDNVEQDEDEPTALVVSAHHAREIVTPVIALYAIGRLTSEYTKDERITAAVDTHEIWIAPVWNPDGYVHVFEVDNFWRKNRHEFEREVGVDLNRNYPFGWDSICSGSDDPASPTYKGESPASEPETQTMMTLSVDRHFARVIDYHSSGRETLWGYRCLAAHPVDAFLEDEAGALSDASGYDGEVRRPSADGEHYQWQLGARGSHSFLIETHETGQPEYESAQQEATLVFDGILAHLERPASVTGHVTDVLTGAPIEVTVTVLDLAYENGETNGSGGPAGRYSLFLPGGPYEVGFAADGYFGQMHAVEVTDDETETLEIALYPLDAVGDVNRDGRVDFADVLAMLVDWGPCPEPPVECPADFDGNGVVDFADLLAVLSNWS